MAKNSQGERGEALTAAYQEVEDEEDEHFYHTVGWTRELWIEALGLQAVLPPPEERRNVRTEVGAARARGAHDEMGPLGLLRSASADDLPEEMS